MLCQVLLRSKALPRLQTARQGGSHSQKKGRAQQAASAPRDDGSGAGAATRGTSGSSARLGTAGRCLALLGTMATIVCGGAAMNPPRRRDPPPTLRSKRATIVLLLVARLLSGGVGERDLFTLPPGGGGCMRSSGEDVWLLVDSGAGLHACPASHAPWIPIRQGAGAMPAKTVTGASVKHLGFKVMQDGGLQVCGRHRR